MTVWPEDTWRISEVSADEVDRQAARRHGGGLFWTVNVKGGQEENWSSGDEDASVGDEKRGRRH